jgi:NAD+ kinase
MKVYIVTNIKKPRVRPAVEELVPWIRDRADVVGVETTAAANLSQLDVDAILVFGGDGTLLSTARRLKGRKTPVMGVNFGRLGFLASFTPEEFKGHFQALIDRTLPMSCRLMLDASVVDSSIGCCFTDAEEVAAKRRWSSTALNDAVISAGAPFRMIELVLGTDSDPGVKYFGDGVILSTPSGSTAYNVSAGGPIVSPNIDAFCITPLCPHSLSFRPVVIASTSKVIVTANRVNEGTTLSCDGQGSIGLKAGDAVVVRRSEHDVVLVENPDAREWRTLAEKLHWAASPQYNPPVSKSSDQ